MYTLHRAVEAGEGLYTGGQPEQSDLQQIVAAGVRRVVDLRTAQEGRGYDEKHALERLQLEYCPLPVKDESDLTQERVTALDELLRGAAGRPTLIHCASGNRVGALLALRAAWLQGAGRDEALHLGRLAGLRSLEPIVRAALTEGEAP